MTSPIPDVPVLRPPRLPRVTTAATATGLAVVAVRRPAVPMAELRLRLPAPSRTAAERATTALLARTLLAGTGAADDLAIARAVQEIGGSLTVGASRDDIVVSGRALARHLPRLAAIVADVLRGAAYPTDRVRNRRERLRSELVIRRANPDTIAADAVGRRLYGRHPYGLGSVDPDRVARIGRGALVARHEAAVHPAGGSLVVVGALRPAAAVAAVAEALAGWDGTGTQLELPPPPVVRPGPVVVVDRPGAVQSNLRFASTGPRRAAPDYAAATLATVALGGYFSSRLVANLREDKGYTYSPRAAIRHLAAGSQIVVGAEVATEVTAAAFHEAHYELGRMITGPPDGAELDSARRYRIGMLTTSLQTQGGLASQLSSLLAGGLDLAWLRRHLRDLATAAPGDAAAAARRWLAPERLATVMVGDAARIVPQLEGLAEVEVVTATRRT